MTRFPMSPAACALFRALLARADGDRDRILLSAVHSVEWHSLTFSGERHELQLRISEPGAADIVNRILADIGDADLPMVGHVVADIAVSSRKAPADGAITVTIEALTLRE